MNNSLRTPQVIRKTFEEVEKRIRKAAMDVGRNPGEIRLVAVTKTQPVSVIQSVIDAGATDLGESYVEEAIPKIGAMANNANIRWHMIGHIQSRKAHSVCENFQFVHSLDSLKLANRLSQFSTFKGKALPVWLEFNVGGEESKSGWDLSDEKNWDVISSDIEKILPLPGLKILGPMTVPPYSPYPENSRKYYRCLKEFQTMIIHRFGLQGFTELSMGMSSDFEVAIQEGATCVRIGQAILGPRGG